MSSEDIHPKGEPIIVDTSVWLHCIAQSYDEPDNNSQLDRNARTHKDAPSPKRLRGNLVRLLCQHPVIVPSTVLRELDGKCKSSDLSQINKKNLRKILTVMFDQETFVPIKRKDVEEQYKTFAELERRGKSEPASIFKKAWDKKFKDEMERVEEARKSCPETGELPYTKTLEKLYELASQREERTKTQEEGKKFHEEYLNLERKARREKPFFLPDLEILLCSEHTNAAVHSLDADFLILRACSPNRFRETTPRPVVKTEAGPIVTMSELKKALAQSIVQKPMEIPNQEEEPEI